jgi:hypothetical protein
LKNIRERIILRFDNGHLIGEVLWDEQWKRAFFRPNARAMLDARTLSYVRDTLTRMDKIHLPWYDRVTTHFNTLFIEPV